MWAFPSSGSTETFKSLCWVQVPQHKPFKCFDKVIVKRATGGLEPLTQGNGGGHAKLVVVRG